MHLVVVQRFLEPHGLTMVLEPLSDSPDLYLRTLIKPS